MIRSHFAPWLRATLVLAAACDRGPDDCHEGVCSCFERPVCELPCPEGGCGVDCFSADLCRLACSAGCELACHDVPRCESRCGDGCSLRCFSASDCHLRCGEACDLRCHDVSACQAEVGEGSQVECARLSSCAIRCSGTCSVACGGDVADCEVRCAPGYQRCDAPGLVRCAESC